LAGFGLVQWQRGASESQLGVRVESHRVTTDVVADEPGESRFGPTQSKHETLVNASASFAQTWAKHWIVRGTFAHTERAPTYFERFANGVHVATAAFERGDSALGKERADHIELGLAWNAGANRLKANVYTTRFKDFIALAPTGEVFEADEQEWRGPAREWARSEESKEPIPVFAFRAVPARFVGAEIESVTRLLRGARTLDLTTRWDVTRANNRETGEPLPRIAPMRLGAGLIWTHGAFRASADVLHARAQRRVPTSQREEPTAHYTLVSASLSYGFTLGANANAKVALRGSNLTNALAYSATSFSQVRERAPLPGRSVSLTLDMAF
jgi:iron complex outermembrane receptor protein